MRYAVPALIFCVLPAFAWAQSDQNAATSGTTIIPVVYDCERGASVPVTFVTPADGRDGAAVMWIDGHQVAMKQSVSGSGFRYVSVQPDRPYELQGKGDMAIIAWGEGDDAPLLLRDCKARGGE